MSRSISRPSSRSESCSSCSPSQSTWRRAGWSAVSSDGRGAPMSASQLLRGTSPRRRGMDRLIYALCVIAGIVALLPLGAVIIFLVVNGAQAWSPAFLVELPGPVATAGGGALHAIVGTLMMTGLALVIATPTALAVAILVVEYRGSRIGPIVRTAVDLLAGVPSIVVGIFVYTLVVLST